MLIISCRNSRESLKENPSSAPELIAASADSVVYLEIPSGRYLLHPSSKLLANLEESTGLPTLTDEVTEFSSDFLLNQQGFETF